MKPDDRRLAAPTTKLVLSVINRLTRVTCGRLAEEMNWPVTNASSALHRAYKAGLIDREAMECRPVRYVYKVKQ